MWEPEWQRALAVPFLLIVIACLVVAVFLEGSCGLLSELEPEEYEIQAVMTKTSMLRCHAHLLSTARMKTTCGSGKVSSSSTQEDSLD